jgi:hypothetical protein
MPLQRELGAIKTMASDRERRIQFNSRLLGTAFRCGYRDRRFEDLHFHDLRHKGTRLPFKAGFAI